MKGTGKDRVQELDELEWEYFLGALECLSPEEARREVLRTA
jgi:hypothetical protein